MNWKTLVSGDRTPSDSLTLGYARVPPGGHLAPHHHAPAEIYFILAGAGTLTLGDATHPVRAGNAVFIPGDARHGIANAGDSDLLFVYAFPTDSFAQVEYHFEPEPK